MPPKRKKTQKNSYFLFLKKTWDIAEAEGRVRGRFEFQEAASRFGYKWRQMSKDEKLPYEDMAKEEKEKEKLNYTNKFTTSGESIAHVNEKALERQKKQQQMIDFISRLTSLPDVGDRTYIFMKAVYSVEEVREQNSKMFWPLEMSMAAFSLKEGIKSIYTMLIDTLEVPMGYMSAAIDNAQRTLLPVPGDSSFTDESRDYREILRKIFGFANHWLLDEPGYDVAGHHRVFFCLEQEIEPIMTGLQWMVDRMEGFHLEKYQYLVDNLKVYKMSELILAMAAEAHKANPSYSNWLHTNLDKVAESIITKGNYDYREEIACPYHKSERASIKIETCAQSFVLRRIFILFDELLPVYEFKRTPRHEIKELRKDQPGFIIKKKQDSPAKKECDTIEEPDWLKDEPQERSLSPEKAYGVSPVHVESSDEDDDDMPSWARTPAPALEQSFENFPSLGGDSQWPNCSTQSGVSWVGRGRGSSSRGARGSSSHMSRTASHSGVGRGVSASATTGSGMFDDEEDFPSLSASSSSG